MLDLWLWQWVVSSDTRIRVDENPSAVMRFRLGGVHPQLHCGPRDLEMHCATTGFRAGPVLFDIPHSLLPAGR
jgi:hypothetical protein